MADTQEISVAERSRLAALDRLAPMEVREYELYCRSGKPELSPDVNKRLYGLYLNGLTIQNMQELNPAFPLGALIQARVSGRWDERKEAYLGELLGDVAVRTKQMAAEALGFMALQMTVMHRKHGEAMKRYLQTGDEKDLRGSGLVPDSIRDQKTIIEAISRLLDAGKGKGTSGDGASPLVSVNVAPGSSVSLSAEDGARRITPEEADAIRAHIESRG
jgi:hypothetical protein